ncbi:hypothetical protein AB4254_11260 [Vibrio breoganii]
MSSVFKNALLSELVDLSSNDPDINVAAHVVVDTYAMHELTNLRTISFSAITEHDDDTQLDSELLDALIEYSLRIEFNTLLEIPWDSKLDPSETFHNAINLKHDICLVPPSKDVEHADEAWARFTEQAVTYTKLFFNNMGNKQNITPIGNYFSHFIIKHKGANVDTSEEHEYFKYMFEGDIDQTRLATFKASLFEAIYELFGGTEAVDEYISNVEEAIRGVFVKYAEKVKEQKEELGESTESAQ